MTLSSRANEHIRMGQVVQCDVSPIRATGGAKVKEKLALKWDPKQTRFANTQNWLGERKDLSKYNIVVY